MKQPLKLLLSKRGTSEGYSNTSSLLNFFLDLIHLTQKALLLSSRGEWRHKFVNSCGHGICKQCGNEAKI